VTFRDALLELRHILVARASQSARDAYGAAAAADAAPATAATAAEDEASQGVSAPGSAGEKREGSVVRQERGVGGGGAGLSEAQYQALLRQVGVALVHEFLNPTPVIGQ